MDYTSAFLQTQGSQRVRKLWIKLLQIQCVYAEASLMAIFVVAGLLLFSACVIHWDSSSRSRWTEACLSYSPDLHWMPTGINISNHSLQEHSNIACCFSMPVTDSYLKEQVYVWWWTCKSRSGYFSLPLVITWEKQVSSASAQEWVWLFLPTHTGYLREASIWIVADMRECFLIFLFKNSIQRNLVVDICMWTFTFMNT